ncbi:hypothetical protein OIO90_006524, partial [Microbotryomycetes sp. JL221]
MSSISPDKFLDLTFYPSLNSPELLLDESRSLASSLILAPSWPRHANHDFLTSEATRFIEDIKSAPQRGSVERFERYRDRRFDVLSTRELDGTPLPTEWKQPLREDVVFGPIPRAGTLEAAPPGNDVCRKMLVQTTFPVGDRIWESLLSTEDEPQLAYTAVRLQYLQQHHLANVANEMVWLDMNSTRRDSRVLTTDVLVGRKVFA